MTFELYEKTLKASEGIFQEIKAVWKGVSLEINDSIRKVDALEMDLEVCSPELLPCPAWHDAQIKRAKILKTQYHLWKWQTELNTYHTYHDSSLPAWSLSIAMLSALKCVLLKIMLWVIALKDAIPNHPFAGQSLVLCEGLGSPSVAVRANRCGHTISNFRRTNQKPVSPF